MMRFDGVWTYIPEHSCKENKTLRFQKDGGSYWFCKVCFRYLGDAGRLQFSDIYVYGRR